MRIRLLFSFWRHRLKVGISIFLCSAQIIAIRCSFLFRKGKRQIIGIFLVEHLGDVVACEPVARYLRREYPDAHLVWCVRPAYVDLLRFHPALNTVLLVHCLSVKDFLVRAELFTQCIDLHFQERYCALCHSHAPAEGSRRLPEITLKNFYLHGNILQSLSRYAGLPALTEKAQVWLPRIPDILQKFSLQSNQYVVIHCSSNTPEKDWDSKHWENLTRYIIELSHFSVVEVGIRPVVPSQTKNFVNACNKTSLSETAELIRSAALFIGIDSGPAHLANAVGTFGIILIGSYLGFKEYNPFGGGYGDGSLAKIIHQNGNVRDLPYEKVKIAVTDFVEQLKKKALLS